MEQVKDMPVMQKKCDLRHEELNILISRKLGLMIKLLGVMAATSLLMFVMMIFRILSRG